MHYGICANRLSFSSQNLCSLLQVEYTYFIIYFTLKLYDSPCSNLVLPIITPTWNEATGKKHLAQGCNKLYTSGGSNP